MTNHNKPLFLCFLLTLLGANFAISQHSISIQETLNLYKDSIPNFGIVALVDDREKMVYGIGILRSRWSDELLQFTFSYPEMAPPDTYWVLNRSYPV